MPMPHLPGALELIIGSLDTLVDRACLDKPTNNDPIILNILLVSFSNLNVIMSYKKALLET